MGKVLLLTTLVGLLPVGLFAQQGDNNQQKTLVLTNVTVIDATGAPAKSDMTVEKSPVKVRRKNAPVLDLRRISVLGGLSGRLIGHTGDQTP
jgi:hypothetical protein